MKATTYHLETCTEAWLSCEDLLVSLCNTQLSFSKRTTAVLDECAKICLSTLHAIKNKFENINNLALLCVGICEECAEVCERYSGSHFQSCAETCRQCSIAFSDLVDKE
jgi:hypothetical protein